MYLAWNVKLKVYFGSELESLRTHVSLRYVLCTLVCLSEDDQC